MKANTMKLVLVLLGGLLLSGCGVTEKSNAVIRGTVYSDSLLTDPLPEVFVRIRIDNAENVPDVFSWTDEKGTFTKSVYLGHRLTETGFEPVNNALIQVKLTYQGKFYNYQDYYLSPRDTLELPPVYFGLFTEE